MGGVDGGGRGRGHAWEELMEEEGGGGMCGRSRWRRKGEGTFVGGVDGGGRGRGHVWEELMEEEGGGDIRGRS